jgi:tetratricopeptide (TPR) repeat protein/energy-coupling factor transporter ATP-binding protein EcfA2
MDIFLSYNSADHNVVENIARKLGEERLEPFLARWHLAPGVRWRQKLEETLSSCKAVAILVGPGEMGSWQQREVDVALDLQGRSPNLPVIPVLLPGCEPPLGFLRQMTWLDLRAQTLDQGIAILARAARGEPHGPEIQKQSASVRASICPYRGLLHFREEDAPFFFGREATIDKLKAAVQRQPLVAVIGASGCGKSSIVRAGLVPRLRNERRTTWETVVLVPTDQPLRALAMALVPLLEPTMGEVDRLTEVAKLAEHLRSGAISLCDIVERILAQQSGTDRLLIVVDQFEELYTLTSNEEARRRFLDEILAASSPGGSKANITLTLRGDFVNRAFADRQLSDRLQDAQINLGPMTREELERAIRKPADKIHLEFESGLVWRILDAVGSEPGNLPLLEFVLKELWEKRHGQILLNQTYDAIGGVQGAVATKADELFKGLSSAEQKMLQRVFLRIVRPSENGVDTCRRAAFTELPSEGAELVGKLANERLLVTNLSAGRQMVEVAHEALISNWGRLRGWVNEDREFLLWRVRLNGLRIEWERVGKSETALLRGQVFHEAQRWYDQRNQDLSDRERKLISASRELRLRERRRRTIVLATAATTVLILFLVLFVLWHNSAVTGSKAKEEARIAEARRLAAQTSEKKANDARDKADGLINFMLEDLRDKLQPLARLDVLDEVAKKSKEYLDGLAKEPATASHIEQRVAMLDTLGDLLGAQGKLQDALDAYQQGLTIAKRRAEQDQSNAAWQRDLSVRYETVGDVMVTQSKLRDALNLYQQDLAISKRLAERDKSNSLWQRDLVVSLYKVGTITAKIGNDVTMPQAREFFREALNVAEKYTGPDRQHLVDTLNQALLQSFPAD